MALSFSAAAKAHSTIFLSFTQDHVASVNLQRLHKHQTACQLCTGCRVDCLHCSTGNTHLRCALLLCQPGKVDQADGLILIKRHCDRKSVIVLLLRLKPAARRLAADTSLLARSRHSSHPLSGICHLYLYYTSSPLSVKHFMANAIYYFIFTLCDGSCKSIRKPL